MRSNRGRRGSLAAAAGLTRRRHAASWKICAHVLLAGLTSSI
jgi:hypothetical protein